MIIDGWKYYNYAAIPTCAPHEEVDTSTILNGNIWKIDGGRPILARWTTNFDCGYETNWWYVIKDKPSVLEEMPKHVRKEIKRGFARLDIRVIDPLEYEEQIKTIYNQAVMGYKNADVSNEILSVEKNNNEEWIGAFILGTEKMIAYKRAKLMGNYVEMMTSKAIPEYRNLNPFAAMNWWQIDNYINSKRFAYLSNGSRNVLHETNYNDYLIDKFGFRKAYCKLCIEYNPKIRFFLKIAYPFRGILKIFNRSKLIRRINGVLLMESIKNNESK